MPDESVAVMVIVYSVSVVDPVVVMVADALPDAVIESGLIVHTGRDVVVCSDVTWQVRATGPLKPLSAVIVMIADVWPPGATAGGVSGPTSSEKS